MPNAFLSQICRMTVLVFALSTRFQQDELHKLIERMTLDAEREELPRSAATASFIYMRLTWALDSKARTLSSGRTLRSPPGTVIKT